MFVLLTCLSDGSVGIPSPDFYYVIVFILHGISRRMYESIINEDNTYIIIIIIII